MVLALRVLVIPHRSQRLYWYFLSPVVTRSVMCHVRSVLLVPLALKIWLVLVSRIPQPFDQRIATCCTHNTRC